MLHIRRDAVIAAVVLLTVAAAPALVLAISGPPDMSSSARSTQAAAVSAGEPDDSSSTGQTEAAEDSSGPITGTDLGRAREAALAYTGGGVATETELGDEESYYEVEVTLADGRQVDVQLDIEFWVVATNPDGQRGLDD